MRRNGLKSRRGFAALFFAASVCFGAAMLSGCGDGPSAADPARESERTLFVSILPQAYLAQRLVGDRWTVNVLVKPGQSPATYDPSPQQMASLSHAQVLFLIGVPFEKALVSRLKAVQPGLSMVDTGQGLRTRILEAHRHGEHDHGHGEPGNTEEDACDPGHEGNDPHIWLDPRLAGKIAECMAREINALDPDHAGEVEANLETLLSDLNALHERLQTWLEPLRGNTFLVFHPAFGYFAEAYGLNQVAVEMEGKEPSARHLMHVVGQAKARHVSAIFVQRQFSQKAAQTVAEAVGGKVVVLDPLFKDYIANLETMARAVIDAMNTEESIHEMQ